MKKICLAIIVCAVLVLSGCSAAPASPQAGLEAVTLQLRGPVRTEYAGYYAALEQGWYREEGIDLTILPGDAGTDVIEDLVEGRSRFGTALMSDLAIAVGGGQPVISLAQIEQMSGLLLISKESSGIGRPVDLVGKRVGTWGSEWEIQMNALFTREGIDRDSVELVSQGQDIQPFLDGRMEVISAMVYDEYHRVLESGLKLEQINIIDFSIFNLDFPGEVLCASRQTLRENPDLCLRMLRATLRGWEYASSHNREAVDIVLKYSTERTLDQKHQLTMLREISRLVDTSWRQMGYTDSSSIQQMLNILQDQQLIRLKLKPEAVFTNELWSEAVQALSSTGR